MRRFSWRAGRATQSHRPENEKSRAITDAAKNTTVWKEGNPPHNSAGAMWFYSTLQI
jgi:hypothetical protein